MKDFIKAIVVYKLKILTKIYLKLKKIEVIAITGSAGKTTTKTALLQFLNQKETYVPAEGYNTEIGIPLVIFKETTPVNPVDFKAWIGILIRSFSKLFKKADYRRIVIEMGADKPGDIKYLTSFIKPKIAIVTTVLPVHTLEFKTVQNIAKEKGYLIEALPKNGTAVLNIDNKYVRMMADRTKAKIVWVGEDKKADVRWSNIVYKNTGINFDLSVRGQVYKVKTKIIAPQLLYSILSAFSVAIALNYEVSELLEKIASFQPEKGRMNLLEGLNDSTIIDDSYNANPDSVEAALLVLNKINGQRKIAVLGSMNELGHLEKEGHQKVGKKATEIADKVIVVGEIAKKYMAPAIEKKKLRTFLTSKEAGNYLAKEVKKGDILLFKGSQNKIYMEEAIKYVLKNPTDVRNLVRQSKMWEDKKADYLGGENESINSN